MQRVFRAQRMIDRVMKEGKGNLLDADTKAFIWKLDGRVGNDYNYRSFVHDEPLVWIEKGEGLEEGTYVALCDCDPM